MSMSLREANLSFRNKDYVKALDLYKEILKKEPRLASALALNISQCEKKLVLQKNYSSSVDTSADTIDVVNKILTIDLRENIEKGFSLPDFSHVDVLLQGVQEIIFDENLLKSSLRCALSSPFQIKLLDYCFKILKSFGLTGVLTQVPLGLNLGTFIKLATDRAYWLIYRKKIEKLLGNLVFSDERLHHIVVNGRGGSESYTWESFQIKNIKKNNEITELGTIALGTILLNEQKFIGLSLFQHYDFCEKWVLVEGTCLGYPTRKVTLLGLSKDKSSDIIQLFPDPLNKIKYVQHGWTSSGGEDAKSELRNAYLKYISEDFLVVLDADEFYRKHDLVEAFKVFKNSNDHAVVLPQVHFWKSTERYITGEYYDISHTRIYKNMPGMKYIRNHNFPELNGTFTYELGQFKFSRTQIEKGNKTFDWKEPRCYHMGFAKDYDDMRDKSDYYVNRGEDITRKSTTESRAAWFDDKLPEKCRIKKWSGEIPFVLRKVNK